MATQELVPRQEFQTGVVLPPMPEISVLESFKIMQLCETDVLEGEAIAVTSSGTYEEAVRWGKKCTDRIKAIRAFIRGTLPLSHNDNRSPLAMVDHVRDAIVAFETDLLKPYLALDEKLKKDATAYRVEQNRIAKETADAERARQTREAEDQRIAQAQKAELMGAATLAEKLLSTPVPTPKVEEKSTIAKGFAGAKARKVWKFEITDRDAVPDEFWCIDEQKLGQVVRTDKDKAVIPGVRVYSEDATSW